MNKNYLQANLVIRSYEPRDLEVCRRLWLELTQWHRDIYHSPNIGGENPGLFFDRHLHQDCYIIIGLTVRAVKLAIHFVRQHTNSMASFTVTIGWKIYWLRLPVRGFDSATKNA